MYRSSPFVFTFIFFIIMGKREENKKTPVKEFEECSVTQS